jgi:tRNA(Ile)-lysidine synthase TilS/MesJ
LKKVNMAVRNYDLINGTDRVAVAVSGWKDSLSHLGLLSVHRGSSREQCDIIACPEVKLDLVGAARRHAAVRCRQ